MINFHPSQQQLLAFSEGTSAPTEALIVSAHCDMCPRCMAIVAQNTENLGSELDILEPTDVTDFGSMMLDITKQEIDLGKPLTKASSTIDLDGKTFVLPRSLDRLSGKMGNWSKLVGKIWQAPVDIGGDSVAHFIFMEKGGSVPEHTHRGSEMTLVLNGEFSDGVSNYDSGDFTVMTASNTHEPKTLSDEGCLVFSIIDKPLHFTSGWARLINPFSHLFFK